MAQQEPHPLTPNSVVSNGDIPKKDPFSPPYVEGLFLGHLMREDDAEEELIALVWGIN